MKRDSSFPFYFFPPSPPTERSREGRRGLVEETEIGRQEKGIRALFEAFFYIDSAVSLFGFILEPSPRARL